MPVTSAVYLETYMETWKYENDSLEWLSVKTYVEGGRNHCLFYVRPDIRQYFLC